MSESIEAEAAFATGEDASVTNLVESAQTGEQTDASDTSVQQDAEEGDASNGTQLVLQQQMIEVNGQQLLVQQAQDPETGELIYFLPDENGQHIAITPEMLSSGLVHVQTENSNDEMIAVAVSQSETAGDSSANHSDMIAVSLDGLAQLAEGAALSSPSQVVADTNIVQSVETPKMSSTIDTSSGKVPPRVAEAQDIDANETSNEVNETPLSNDEVSNLQAQQETAVTLENHQSTDQATLNASGLNSFIPNAVGNDGNYVIMTSGEDGTQTEINLADMLSAGGVPGQTFLLQTSDGNLVACTAPQSGNGSIQLVTDNGDLAENASISGGQVISGGHTVTYSLSTTGELTPLENATPTVNPPSPKRNIKQTKTAIQAVSFTKTLDLFNSTLNPDFSRRQLEMVQHLRSGKILPSAN